MKRLLAHLRSDAGMALPTVIGVLILVSALTAGLLATVQADTGLSRRDQDRKAAYAAAEAGLNAYLFRLNDNSEIWASCTAIGGTPYVSQEWSGSGSDSRSWRSIPGSQAQYTVELLPNSSSTTCDATSPTTAANTLLDEGTINIRSTGRMRGLKRSIVTRLRRHSFLDFIYFTNYETRDPAWYTPAGYAAWASTNCGYWRDGRGSKTYSGGGGCVELNFIAQDSIVGPFHTNDSILTCGSPTFGGGGTTHIELNPPSPGWRANGGASCSGSPTFSGMLINADNVLAMPPTNLALQTDTLPAYVFTGSKRIVLGATTFDITDVATGATTSGVPYPPNGLIYVRNGSCGVGYNAVTPLAQPAGCANVFVHGTIGTSLTLASQKDVIVDGDITNSNDALLGLVANEFVRVQHVVSPASTSTCTANASPVLNDIRIEAAILSLAHSFAVDSYTCGSGMGTLHVFGSIAQNYRGAVGTFNSSGLNSGYVKDYRYDNRLSYRSPPHFLDPVSASWRVLNQHEQTPAR